MATLDAFFQAECAAADKAGAVCLDNYHAFNGPQGLQPAGKLLGDDYTHPSQKGHDLFARLLMDVDVTHVIGQSGACSPETSAQARRMVSNEEIGVSVDQR